MGQQPKRGLISHEEAVRVQALVNAAAPANMPKDAYLRGQIIKALMERIKTICSKEEYNHCFGSIVGIAKLEEMDWEDKAADIQMFLDRLAGTPALKWGHSPEGISLQREALIDFLMARQFPTTKGPETRKRWIEEQWKDIVTLATKFPCRCEYRTSFEAFTVNVKKYYTPRTHPKAADLLLASFHGLDPESVRKNKYLFWDKKAQK